MDFVEIVFSLSADNSEKAQSVVCAFDTDGMYIEDYTDLEEGAWEIAHIDIIDEELLKKDRSRVLIHIYLEPENAYKTAEDISNALRLAGIEHSVSTANVSEDDWKDNWKQYFKPTEIGERLAIKPSWELYENNDNRAVLEIDPGAAFGTGTHATTLMCLEFLDEYIKGGERVLDIGCGSGILAIAALLLGAESAEGVDIDSVAVNVAKENAALNGLSDKAQFVAGDLAEHAEGKYDIVCANIVADVIIRLCENVTDYMKQSSRILFSGIISERSGEVKVAAEKAGMRIIKELTRDGWTALVAEIK